MTSQAGEATPSRASMLSQAELLLMVLILSNHGSWIKKMLVFVALFNRVWVTVLCLCMFTDMISMYEVATIKGGGQQQCFHLGARGVAGDG